MLPNKFCLMLLGAPLCVGQRLPPVAPWTLPLFTSDPTAVLAAASNYGAPENADAIVLSYFINVQVDAAGKLTQTTRRITRVLRLQGVASVRQVNIGWLPSREDRPKIKARVITSDGKPHLLADTAIKETVPVASGPHLLTAILPAVDFDSIVELESVESDRQPIYPGGRWGEIWLDARNPIYQFTADIASDPRNPLRVDARGFPQDVRRLPQSNVREMAKGHITIDAARIPPPARSILLPPDAPPSPLITFSTADNWQAVAQWGASHPEALTTLFADAHGAFEEVQQPKTSQVEGYPASTVGDVGGFIDLPRPGSVKFRSLGPLLDPRAPDEPGRTLDYYAYPPFTDEVRYHASLPPGFHFGEIPPMTNIPVGPAQRLGIDEGRCRWLAHHDVRA